MTKVLDNFSVELLWNKGIAALCDRRIPDEFPDHRHYSPVPTLAGAMSSSKLPDNLIPDHEAYSDIRDGELIWVRVSWVKSFIKQILPVVQSRFVLITGDSDSCMPAELGSEARVLLGSPKIAHWYTQNYDGSIASKKISPVPIGIDFHMLSERPIWGETICSPEQQEAVLKSVGAELRPREDRIQQVYVDFAWQQGWGLRNYRRYHPLTGSRFHESRRRVAKKLQGREAVFCQNGPLPRTELWRRRGEYAFVLSPHGMGLDCHRTWEALALGHIVLVPTSSLDSLYTGLPVVPLNDWNEITSDNLGKWLLQFQGSRGIHEKLKSSYWVAKMRETAENQGAVTRLHPSKQSSVPCVP
jgi:hypothetical protein